MALYRRNKTWWLSISVNGQRIQRSTGTNSKIAAQEYHDKFKAEFWDQLRLQKKPAYSWRDAVVRWLNESSHKKSLDDDKGHLRWLDNYLGGYLLSEIDRDVIEDVALKKEATGVKPVTVNRMLEILRAILRKAQKEWDWLDKIPTIRMRHIEKNRVRWLSISEANRLLKELPNHLESMVAFSLATGLRASNVTGLKWQDVDLNNNHAWIHAEQSKSNKAIAVPLNAKALAILRKQMGEHPAYVFTYKGAPIKQCNTKAWKKALARSGIENFRWHDLRHTWASWHVQNGTSLQELQQLGGWASLEMVLRYAHLSSKHLKSAADRLGNIGLCV